jgi:hypothetical protein
MYQFYYQFKKMKIMRKLTLMALIVVIAATAHAQTDTTVVATTAVILKGKAYLRTTTTATKFEEITGQTILNKKMEQEDRQEQLEVERLTKQRIERQSSRQELNRLIKQALVNSSITVDVKTEAELAEIQKLRREAIRERVKPIK